MEEQGSDYGESKKHSREEHKDADAVRAAQGPLGCDGVGRGHRGAWGRAQPLIPLRPALLPPSLPFPIFFPYPHHWTMSVPNLRTLLLFLLFIYFWLCQIFVALWLVGS